MSENLVSTELLMKMVEITRPQAVQVIEHAEGLESLKKRYEYYVVSLIILAKKSRLMLFLAARTLIVEGADPLSVKLALEEIQRSPGGDWIKVINEENTLAQLQGAVAELTPIADDIVSRARRAPSVEDRYDDYLRLMITLARNMEIRLFLLRSSLMETGADKRSVEAAARTYADDKELW